MGQSISGDVDEGDENDCMTAFRKEFSVPLINSRGRPVSIVVYGSGDARERDVTQEQKKKKKN